MTTSSSAQEPLTIVGVNKLFDQIFDGIPMNDIEKNALVGSYTIAVYKVVIEVLAAIDTKVPNLNFFQEFIQLVNKKTQQLPEDESKKFFSFLDKEKEKILTQIINIFSQNLSIEMKAKIESNLFKLK